MDDMYFDDLSEQFEQGILAEGDDLRRYQERNRLEKLSVRIRVSNVVRAAGPGNTPQLSIVLASGESVLIRPTMLGSNFIAADLLGAGNSRWQCVIPIWGIAGVLLTAEQDAVSLADESPSDRAHIERTNLLFVLRIICSRRTSVQLDTFTGTLTGTIDRVGSDHVDLAVHPPGTLRRAPEVTHQRLVPLSQIQIIRHT